MTLANKIVGNTFLIAVSFLWLILLADTLGWFLTFEQGNIALWGLIGIPTIASLLVAHCGIGDSQWKSKTRIATILAALIPILGVLSYANKTYERNVFSEFYNVEKKEYEVIFKPQPSDTRKFEIKMSSDELRKIVIENATFVANHHYLPNAKFEVNMTFSKINEIELVKVSDYKLEQPIKWKFIELNGDTEFLK
ncbi:MAG: hypothetical protein IPL46_04560 [Saprospiraceae bacterium]|nr:hypothetical protein [Saprospiraceae bacterium]